MIHSKVAVCGLMMLSAAGLSAAVGGCAARPETSGQLLDRLTSAEEITTTGPRESAMADIAKTAAISNQPNICLRAVDAIRSQSALRSSTAQACSATFNDLGERPTADALVNRIDDPNLRNQIRIDYAEHPTPNHTTRY